MRGLAANVTRRNMRGSVGKRCWILHTLKTVQKPFHQWLAMPYWALAWRSDTAKHHLFFFLILFLYSNLPLAWDSKLNATCTKSKRTCHSTRNIILLENQHSLYILELPFSFSKDTSQLPTCSYVVYSKQPNTENNIANTFGGVTNGSSGQTQRTAPEAVSAREKFKTKNTATLRMCADFLYSFAQERTLLCSSHPSPHGRPKWCAATLSCLCFFFKDC